MNLVSETRPEMYSPQRLSSQDHLPAEGAEELHKTDSVRCSELWLLQGSE